MITAKLAAWWADVSVTEMIWVVVGIVAQLMFSMRFLIQWIASERARQSIVPEAFWYFSVLGGALLFAYATYRLDPVFMLGQGMGLFIYARNIQLIWKDKVLVRDGAVQRMSESGSEAATAVGAGAIAEASSRAGIDEGRDLRRAAG